MHNSFLLSPPVKETYEKKLPGFQRAFLSAGTPAPDTSAPDPPTLSICFHKELGLTSSPHLPQHRVPPAPQRHTRTRSSTPTYRRLPALRPRSAAPSSRRRSPAAAGPAGGGAKEAERRRPRPGASGRSAARRGGGRTEGGKRGRARDAAAPWMPHWKLRCSSRCPHGLRGLGLPSIFQAGSISWIELSICV